MDRIESDIEKGFLKLIREIRQSRSGPLSALLKYSYLGIVVMIVILAFIIYEFRLQPLGTFRMAMFIYAALMVTGTLFTIIYNLLLLRKIDFTQNVGQNIQLIHNYKKGARKQLVVIYSVVIIFVTMVTIATLLGPPMEPWRWTVMGIALVVGVIAGYWEYKKMYKEKTEAILRSLEELKELEEE